MERRKELFPKYEQTIDGNEGDNSSVIPFDIHIPKEIRRSYLERYFEYYRLLEAKLDVPWCDDLYARTSIQTTNYLIKEY